MQGVNKQHSLILENRATMSLSGVKDVESFDENALIIFTNDGVLAIKGKGLHVKKFSIETGDLSVEGRVNSMVYTDEIGHKGKERFFAKLFK